MLVLQLIQVAGKQSTVLEDAFLVVGNMASGLYCLYTNHSFLMILCSVRTKFPPLFTSIPPFLGTCTESIRRSSALFGCCWVNWGYLPCSRRSQRKLLRFIHDISTRKFDQSSSGTNRQDLGSGLFWGHCDGNRAFF
jgi:hypothetical protein